MEKISNVEAEQALLGAMLTKNETFYLLPADFEEGQFYEPLHSAIFIQIRNCINAGEKCDLFVIARYFDKENKLDALGGAKLYLTKLVQAAFSMTNFSAVAKQIIDLSERRVLLSICHQAIEKMQNLSDEQTSGELAAWLGASVEKLSTASRFNITTEKQVTEKLLAMLQSGKGIERSQTGIVGLDAAMDGGLYAGKLYGIVGRKKMGKTMLAGTISHNLQKTGHKHLYLALEMGSIEIHQRSIAREIGCKEAAFRLGASTRILEQIAEYVRTAENHRLYLDAPCLSFDDLRHILPQYIRKHKIKGFILDCWQLVGGKDRGKSTAEHLDEVAQWLAECCKKHQIWGLVTAQENQDENTRGGEGIRLACDQIYRICKRDESCTEAWLEMMETRYTRWQDVGSENSPSLLMSENGTHYHTISN